MYVVAHLEEHAQRPPRPEPVPRPGADVAAASPASAYDLGHVPAIDPAELGAWLST